ncbi:hypothetical protein skT53_25350 [Effusibacillus dendaii]|uniref:RNA polymerase sigma factor 70 region 4 type 2 domain-containing protein n=1 Tax=Effusibacillus dendaii TaxID=2743772 RepID=A0A7I8DG50_9BACL|nr:hypothetical protein skT53_25350 [Effusibacillus dendaii]
MLQQLNPVERAVLLLREVFAFEYAEIGEMIGKGETNCRKIHSRAKSKLHPDEQIPLHEPEQSEKYVQSFLKAAHTGQFHEFVNLLAEDAVLYSDGGGKVRSAVRPIHSRNHIAQFITGLYQKTAALSASVQIDRIPINGESGAVITVDGQPFTIVAFQIQESRIQSLYLMRNPGKTAAYGIPL